MIMDESEEFWISIPGVGVYVDCYAHGIAFCYLALHIVQMRSRGTGIRYLKRAFCLYDRFIFFFLPKTFPRIFTIYDFHCIPHIPHPTQSTSRNINPSPPPYPQSLKIQSFPLRSPPFICCISPHTPTPNPYSHCFSTSPTINPFRRTPISFIIYISMLFCAH